MQNSAEFESIKRGVTALSSLTYCQPATAGVPPAVLGLPSILGKRTAEPAPMPHEGYGRFGGPVPQATPDSHSSKLLQYVSGISQTNPISNAWMIHQGNFAENNDSDNSEEDSEEPSNVPLHLAVGYGEESYPFFHGHEAPPGIAHAFPGFPLGAHPVLHPAMLGASDAAHHPLGMWPFGGPDALHPSMSHLHDFRLGGTLVATQSSSNHQGNEVAQSNGVSTSSSRGKPSSAEFSSARIVPRMQPISDSIQRDGSRFAAIPSTDVAQSKS